MKIKSYLKLIRPKHYLKNVLIFLPLVFSGQLFKDNNITFGLVAFAAFSLAASSVYIINDIRDRKLDALHPKKKFRPIASGEINPASAAVLAILLIVTSLFIQVAAGFSVAAIGMLLGYVGINLLYSFGLKNVPIMDVAILSLGFVLRVFYGGLALDISVSKWLYLAILAFSFYLSLGKRRNEIRSNGAKTRKVNQFYTQDFLDKNMYVFFGLTIVYYTLWTIDPAQQHKRIIWTIPLIIVIAMSYSLAVESGESDGDPVSVVLGSKILLGLTIFTGILMLALVYI